MKPDGRALPVTTRSSEAIEVIDHFANQLVSLGPDAGAILDACEAFPDCAMVQAYAACTYVFAQSSRKASKASALLLRARAHFSELTEREKLFIQAVEAGSRGDFGRAISLYEQIARRWPRDIVAAKVAEFHFFETGESPRQLDFMRAIAEPNSDNPHVQAMYAFALELCGFRDEAEVVARESLRTNPLTMWAQHALAHVFGEQSRIAQGISELQGFADGWRSYGQYIQSHNWFHLAALHLANLDFARVRDAYRSHIWGFVPDEVVEQTDAILLLWYLELAGAAVEGEWRGIAPYVRANAHEQVFPFLNALFLYALSRAGETAEVDAAMAEMARFAARQTGRAAHVWREIGMPLVRGCVAFARGQYDPAAAMLGPIIDDVATAGGSDEQRGVFVESHLVSLINAGHKTLAAKALQRRVGSRTMTPLERRWMDQL